MSKLLENANLDDQFSTQMGKVQAAIVKLKTLVDKMTEPDANGKPKQKPTATQRMQLRYAAEDLAELHKKSQ